jgi:hypothetical protein
MTIRPSRLGAALFATIALVACTKPADKPVTDSTAAANATPAVVAPIDSTAPAHVVPPKPDSAKPTPDSTKPAKK